MHALTTDPALAWINGPYAKVLLLLLVLAALGTAALFGLGLVAYRRRRTRAYGFVALALGLLLVRSAVGLGTLSGHVPMALHHGIAHGIDLLVAVLLLAAVYVQRLDMPA